MAQAGLNKRNCILGGLGLMLGAKLVMKSCVSKKLAELAKSWQQKLLNVSILNFQIGRKLAEVDKLLKVDFFISKPYLRQIENE